MRHFIGDRPLHDAQRESLAHLAGGRELPHGDGDGPRQVAHLPPARRARGDRARARRRCSSTRCARSSPTRRSTSRSALAEIGVACRAGHRRDLARRARRGVRGARRRHARRRDDHAGVPRAQRRAVRRERAASRFVVVDEAHHVGLSGRGSGPRTRGSARRSRRSARPVVLAVTATAARRDRVRRSAASSASTGRVLDPTVRDNLRVEDRRGGGGQGRVRGVARRRAARSSSCT